MRGGDPILWDFGSAAVHHKLYSPWLKPENCKAGLVGLRGTVDPAFGLMKRHAEEMASILKSAGVAKMPIGVDIIEPPMMFELEKAGLKIKDGQQVMLEAREVKSADEIALLNRAAAMVDGAYDVVNEMLRPGVRENDIVAEVNKFLYTHGSDDVEAINAISGERCNPHPHNFTDRMIRPGDQAFFDILQAFMGYRTCYYRTFNVVRATPAQHDAYKLCARMARQRHRADQARRRPRISARCCRRRRSSASPTRSPAFGLQFAHGLGLNLHERPIISPRGVDGPPDRDQGRHGVRDRNLLPGQGRLFRRAHRGRGRGHRQGPHASSRCSRPSNCRSRRNIENTLSFSRARRSTKRSEVLCCRPGIVTDMRAWDDPGRGATFHVAPRPGNSTSKSRMASSDLPKTAIAEHLAQKICALDAARLPAAVREKCEELLIDVVGLAVTARNEDYVEGRRLPAATTTGRAPRSAMPARFRAGGRRAR